jgi:hypothetical protein
VQLWGYLLLGDVLVVGREGVAVEAEGAYPDTGAHVNLAIGASAVVPFVYNIGVIIPEGVEDGLAGSPADNGLILKQRRVRLLLQRGVEGANGDHEARGFLREGSACPRRHCDGRWAGGSGQRTMRELGNVFQLRRRPSLSSISLHWSLRASKSAMLSGPKAGRDV